MNKYKVLVEAVLPTPNGDDRKAVGDVVELTEEQAASLVESNVLELLEEGGVNSLIDESKKNDEYSGTVSGSGSDNVAPSGDQSDK